MMTSRDHSGGNVTDMREVLVAEFDQHLAALGSCERDHCEKCLDRWLAGEERFSVDDVTCGCGCWTLGAYRVQLGYVREVIVLGAGLPEEAMPDLRLDVYPDAPGSADQA
jgi:hypothetical protein